MILLKVPKTLYDQDQNPSSLGTTQTETSWPLPQGAYNLNIITKLKIEFLDSFFSAKITKLCSTSLLPWNKTS